MAMTVYFPRKPNSPREQAEDGACPIKELGLRVLTRVSAFRTFGLCRHARRAIGRTLMPPAVSSLGERILDWYTLLLNIAVR